MAGDSRPMTFAGLSVRFVTFVIRIVDGRTRELSGVGNGRTYL